MSTKLKIKDAARTLIARGIPSAILDRSPALNGTRFLSNARSRSSAERPFQMVNVGACDGVLFDDVTPWLRIIPHARAVLVEPVPYNQKRLRANYPDTERFIIEPVAVTGKPGTISIKTFDESSIESGKLPIEFVGCSSIAGTNLMSGKDAWGREDSNFDKYTAHLKEIDVQGDRLETVLDRNAVKYIDAFLVDCEGADWLVFEQLDLERYRPGMIKIEIGALGAEDIGNVILKLKTNGYRVGLYAEDVWAFV
ncbi:MAG: FkbM family methyltransferase [Beijerinckiaceae bacterium]